MTAKQIFEAIEYEGANAFIKFPKISPDFNQYIDITVELFEKVEYMLDSDQKLNIEQDEDGDLIFEVGVVFL